MSREGQKLGRYKLVRRKGAGGMAEVWEAYDEVLDRTVAVKVIGVSIAGEKEFRDRFLREARLAAKLEHKNILPIYDFGMQEDTAYLVMPLLPGGTLKERLQQPLTPEDVIDILASIGAALDHAHESGILHRDVKPSNVLVDKAGHLLLADFGLAKATEGTSGLTMTGAILGTPLYMPPEQAAGLPVDSRADQYSLGVIAYQVLTGSLPFMAESPLSILNKHLTMAPPFPSLVRPDLPARVDGVIQRVLAKTPDERYPTCTEFVADLAECFGLKLSRRGAVPYGEETPTIIGMSTPAPSGASRSGGSRTQTTRPAVTLVSPPPPALPPPLPVSGEQALPSMSGSSPGASKGPLALALLAGVVLAAGGFFAYRQFGAGGASSGSSPEVPTPSASSSPTPAPRGAAATPVPEVTPEPEELTVTVSDLETPTPVPPKPTRTPLPESSSSSGVRPTSTATESRTTEKTPETKKRHEILPGETKKVETRIAFSPEERLPIGIVVGDILVESVEVKDLPDEGDLEKAAKDESRTYKATAVFRYTNDDKDHDYKCRYELVLLSASGEELARGDRTATQNSGEKSDTNKVSIVGRAIDYQRVKRALVRLEIKKD